MPNASDWDAQYERFSANSDYKDNEHYDAGYWANQVAEEKALRASGGGAQNCPDNLPFTSRPGANGERTCAAKPDDCPDGQVIVGSGPGAKCVPQGQVQGGQGGPGGGGGGGGQGFAGGGGDGYGDWSYGLADMYKKALADPKQAQALVLGSGGAGEMQNAVDNIDKQLAGLPAGHPARAALEAQKMKLQTQGGLQIAQLGQANAIQGLGGMGATNANWLLGNRGLELDKYKTDKSTELGWGNLGLGYANLGENRRQYDTGLDWTKDSFGRSMDFNRWATNLGSQDSRYAANMGYKSAKAGAIGQGIGGILGMFSDARVKENIAPGRRGLSELRKLPIFKYNYKEELDPSKHPMMGVMAQDVEKVAPELVAETSDGIKMVNGYGLLALTMKAVKDLDVKLTNMEKKNAH